MKTAIEIQNKIIASSNWLYRYLVNIKLFPDLEYTLSVDDNGLSITGVSACRITVEHIEPFTIDVPGYRLARLQEILKIIPEQPVVIKFCDNGWIEIVGSVTVTL